ncbi:MAG: hypothetical protein QXQ91_01910 [Nanopusillaceae archaeon]
MTEIKYVRAKELTEEMVDEIVKKITEEVITEIAKVENCIEERIAQLLENGAIECKGYELEVNEADYTLPSIEDIKSKIANKIYDVLIEKYKSLQRVKLKKKNLFWINASSEKYIFEFDTAIVYVANTAIFDFALESVHVNY